MKQKDMKILSHLRNNSRIPLTRMSKKTSIPVSTIFDKLKDFERDLIMRHTTLINFKTLGYNARVNVSIKVGKECKEKVRQFLVSNEKINSVYKINNGYDFMFEGIFKDIEDMQDFLEKLESKHDIEDHNYYFIIEDIKRESFLTRPELYINNA